MGRVDWKSLYPIAMLHARADAHFAAERQRKRLTGWFRVLELRLERASEFAGEHPVVAAAQTFAHVVERLPLELDDDAVFAGTQRDAFAPTYALINPTFRVESFTGYCDPLAVFDAMTPDDEFPAERIAAVKEGLARTPFVRELSEVYRAASRETKEVAYFVEQVTGHTVADFRPLVAHGVEAVLCTLDDLNAGETDADRRAARGAMKLALGCAVTLAGRYAALCRRAAAEAGAARREELLHLAATLDRVPRQGARDLFEAIQSYLLLWQVMCLEQTPNPYAFSAGNADRIFEPYRAADGATREAAAALFRHLLGFFNVGERSWAISQNLMVGGRDADGNDLTSTMSYAVLDAYSKSNYPQPILSVKLHAGTPVALHEALGGFWFTPGRVTPSLFNDDAMFEVLARASVAREDLPDYAIAGCQEPLVMGKDSGQTTASWLNLGKVLELTLQDGVSALTGERIGPTNAELGIEAGGPTSLLRQLRPAFHRQLAHYIARMVEAANGCSRALAYLPVPFLSACMGGIRSGVDLRDTRRQGTKYQGSGCLIHGLSVVADSFVAIDELLAERPQDAGRLLQVLRDDFAGAEDLRQFLASAPKYGNDLEVPDGEAALLAGEVADLVAEQRNDLGNRFRPDYSSPSTHLLYGYWVGATPDGRRAREMLGYGLDPLYGEATSGLGGRTLSIRKLPFEKMTGGYASHFGVDPRWFTETGEAAMGRAFHERVVGPLFCAPPELGRVSPYYLYVNVNTPDVLRKVLANPKRYAPTGVYIMRIHGTYVNFLDLSPAIQEDIIRRLDLDPAARARRATR
jgi:choline trimethylamine-lyase